MPSPDDSESNGSKPGLYGRLSVLGLKALQAILDLRSGLKQTTVPLSLQELPGTPYPLRLSCRGKGPAVLLIHGFASDKGSWSEFIHHLSKDFRVIAIDLPGWGASPFYPDLSYGPPHQAERIEALRIAMGIDRWHIAGFSMGGAVAGLYACSYPERVLSLGLIDSAGFAGAKTPPFFDEVAAGRNPLIAKRPEDIKQLLAYVFHRPPPLPAWARQALYEQYRQRIAIHEQIFRDLIAEPQCLEHKLPRLRVPTLMLWGREDRVLDVSCTEVFKQGYPKGEIHIFDDCGHLPPMEKPRKTALLFEEFWRRSQP